GGRSSGRPRGGGGGGLRGLDRNVRCLLSSLQPCGSGRRYATPRGQHTDQHIRAPRPGCKHGRQRVGDVIKYSCCWSLRHNLLLQHNSFVRQDIALFFPVCFQECRLLIGDLTAEKLYGPKNAKTCGFLSLVPALARKAGEELFELIDNIRSEGGVVGTANLLGGIVCPCFAP